MFCVCVCVCVCVSLKAGERCVRKRFVYQKIILNGITPLYHEYEFGL